MSECWEGGISAAADRSRRVGLLGVSSLFDTVAQAGEAGWYDSCVTNPDDTAWAVAIVAIIAGAVWVWWIVPAFERRRLLRENCSHTLALDACQPPNVMFSTLRCSKGCGYQETAREYIAAYHRELEARRIELCPHCGSADRCR